MALIIVMTLFLRYNSAGRILNYSKTAWLYIAKKGLVLLPAIVCEVKEDFLYTH